MSLVIEALRRVEKPDARTGTIGAAVASYRPAPRPRGSVVPLLLGLLTGGAMVFLLGAQSRNGAEVSARSGDDGPALAPQDRPLKGAAGLPPPLIIEPAVGSIGPRPSLAAATPALQPDRPTRAAGPVPPLVLQAISERDSRPIAIINDQLVREGDKVGAARVLRIGPDLVEVMLENGQHDTVRFAPPPPPEAQPSASPDPRS